VPDGVAYLAQTRHTMPAGQSTTSPNPAHRRATGNAVPPLQGDLTHHMLVHNGHGFKPLSGRPRRPSPSRVRLKRSIGSLSTSASELVPGLAPFDSQEVSGEF
jgi:hypothetical protein